MKILTKEKEKSSFNIECSQTVRTYKSIMRESAEVLVWSRVQLFLSQILGVTTSLCQTTLKKRLSASKRKVRQGIASLLTTLWLKLHRYMYRQESFAFRGRAVLFSMLCSTCWVISIPAHSDLKGDIYPKKSTARCFLYCIHYQPVTINYSGCSFSSGSTEPA